MHLLCWRAQTLACFLEQPERRSEMVPSITPLISDWLSSVMSFSESLGCFHLITVGPLIRKALSFSHLANMNDNFLLSFLASGCR